MAAAITTTPPSPLNLFLETPSTTSLRVKFDPCDTWPCRLLALTILILSRLVFNSIYSILVLKSLVNQFFLLKNHNHNFNNRAKPIDIIEVNNNGRYRPNLN